MAEEPSLPRLPAVSWDKHSQSFSNNPRKRAHQSRCGSLCNSSDPAVFSSDDDPGLDNYVEGRKKKRYVGTWFQQQPTSSDSTFSDCLTLPMPKKERKLVRHFDSGVYLGSDGTDDLDPEILEMPVRSKMPQLDQRPPPASTPSKAELLAREKIQACLEKGEETIDFWSMGLEEISNEILSPLSNFSCIPVVAKDVAFEQKEPELKMYLTMNRLRLVPGALFDLKHLTILSLRGNKLTELPPAIAKLSNLKQLNVSQNRLRSLPAELLELFDLNLKDVILYPNAFFEPDSTFDHDTKEQNICEVVEERLMARKLGRSPLQVSDSAGQVLSKFRFPACHESTRLRVADDDEGSDMVDKPSRVPSLLELALRSCYGTKELSALRQYIPDGLPQLRDLLERAVQQKQVGGISCTNCKKLVIVPPIEWIEWREMGAVETLNNGKVLRPLSLADDEKAVPLLYRCCSWKCAALGNC